MIVYNVKMYNEDRKKRFIRDYTGSLDTSKYAENVFKIVAKYELEWDADICTHGADRLQLAVNKVLALGGERRWMSLIILKEYNKWCKAMGVRGVSDDILYMSLPEIDNVRLKMVANPVQLQSFLNDIFEPEIELLVDNTYRCWYWMAYGGIPQQDASKIETSAIDLPHMTIEYDGVRAPIYREAVPAFRNAINLSSFKYKHPNYGVIYRGRTLGTTVLRGLRGDDERNVIYMRNIIGRLNATAIKEGKTNRNLNYLKVQKSGLYYRVYELEKIGVPVNLSTLLENAVGTKINMQENLAMNDYCLWKLAFTE